MQYQPIGYFQPNLATATQSRRRKRRGAVVVEFALVGSLFFMLCFASIEFARFSIVRQLVDNAAYEAARAAIVPGVTSAEVSATAQSYMSKGMVTGTIVDLTPAVITDETAEVTVTVTVPFNQNSWVVPQFFTGVNLVGECKLRAERFR